MFSRRWCFSKEVLDNSPSRECGCTADKELSYRQQAANFIQDVGQRLLLNQHSINTAIVYMHRFFVFHSITKFNCFSIASTVLFLAAKVEQQPRKLEHVVKLSYVCLHRGQQLLEVKSEKYAGLVYDLIFNESIALPTLGFDLVVEHPHQHIVKCCGMIKVSKDVAKAAYIMATNSLHLTTMCLQYEPTTIACFCIYLVCKWSNWIIPLSSEGKEWFWYVDKNVTNSKLEKITNEFLDIFDKSPSKLKKKLMSNLRGTALPNCNLNFT